MDSVTQAVLGAVVGEIILGPKLGWKGAVWGAALGTVPDLDVIFLPFLDAADGIRWHRGISHSFVVMVLAGLLLAWPLARRCRAQGVTAWEMGWTVFWAWSTHVLIDCFTTYGTQVLEPFSDARLAMNLFFIVDPLFTLPLLVGLWVSLRRPVGSQARKKAVWLGGVVASLYVFFAWGMQTWARQEIARTMVELQTRGRLVQVAPASFNTVLWRGLVEDEQGYSVIYWSPFDGGVAGKPAYIEKHRELMKEYEGEKVFDALKWFSKGHWVARRGAEGEVILYDLRLGEVRDPRSGQIQQIFQWHVTRDANGVVHAPMLRPQGLDYAGATGMLLKRVCGNAQEWDAVRSF